MLKKIFEKIVRMTGLAVMAATLCFSISLYGAALPGEDGNVLPLGPLGGNARLRTGTNHIRIDSLQPHGPAAKAGLRVDDILIGVFDRQFKVSPGSTIATAGQDLGLAVDYAESRDGKLPLMVMRGGAGLISITVQLDPVGGFGAAYPLNCEKYFEIQDYATQYVMPLAANATGINYTHSYAGMVLLGHPEWNGKYRPALDHFTGAVTKFLDGIDSYNVEGTLQMEDGGGTAPYASSVNKNAGSNWTVGPALQYLVSYYTKLDNADPRKAILAEKIKIYGQKMSTRVQWWKQPRLVGNYSPTLEGIISHGGVTGDYIHLGWGGGINICSVHHTTGFAAAKQSGLLDLNEPSYDAHYHYPKDHPVPSKWGDHQLTVGEKFEMAWKWMSTGGCAYYNNGNWADGHVCYTLQGASDFDAAGRTAGAALTRMLADGGLDSVTDPTDRDHARRMLGYVARRYGTSMNSHTYCFPGPFYGQMCTPYMTVKQQRYWYENMKFYFALSRAPDYKADGSKVFKVVRFNGRAHDEAYVDMMQAAMLNAAIGGATATGGQGIIPAFKKACLIPQYREPFVTWPSEEARYCAVNGTQLAFDIQVTDGHGERLSGYDVQWRAVTGGDRVMISQPAKLGTMFTFSKSGKYRLSLTLSKPGYESWQEFIDADVSLSDTPEGFEAGKVTWDIFKNISGNNIASMTGSAKYPASPDESLTGTALDFSRNIDNYGSRIYGYILPPKTDTYTFYVSADDSSEFHLNPAGADERPQFLEKMASNPSATARNNFTQFTSQKSRLVVLKEGTPYYFELLMKEGGGGDFVQCAWGSVSSPSPVTVPSGSLARRMTAVESLMILTQPKDVSVPLGGSVRFNVTVSGPGPLLFQWRKNGGQIVSSSVDPIFEMSNISGGAAGEYDCMITSPAGVVVTRTARLTVEGTAAFISGALWREDFKYINGNNVSDMTGHSKYPHQCDVSDTQAVLDINPGAGDAAGIRLSGWITFPETAEYRFMVNCDDTAEIWISPDENPEYKKRIVSRGNYGSYRDWNGAAKSPYAPYQAGKRYYIEILQKNGGGGDYLCVNWQKNGTPMPANGTASAIPSSALSCMTGGSGHDPNPDIPPSAIDDQFTVGAGCRVTVAPLENDIDFAVSKLQITSLGAPAFGTVELTSDGRRVIYTAGAYCPPDGDVFSYTVRNQFGKMAQGRVRMRMLASPGGLRHWWSLNEISDSTVYDYQSMADAAVYGDPVRVAGVCEGALNLNGEGDYLEVENLDALLRGNVTLSFWIKTTQVGDNVLLPFTPALAGYDTADNAAEIKWGVINAAGKIGMSLGSRELVSQKRVNDGVWHHVVLTRAGAGSAKPVKLYVDNAMTASYSGVNESSLIGSLPYSTFGRVMTSNPAVAGQSAFLRAALDDIRIYNSVLTIEQVGILYALRSEDPEKTNVKIVAPDNGRSLAASDQPLRVTAVVRESPDFESLTFEMNGREIVKFTDSERSTEVVLSVPGIYMLTATVRQHSGISFSDSVSIGVTSPLRPQFSMSPDTGVIQTIGPPLPLTVTLSSPVNYDVAIPFSLSGSAVAGKDYTVPPSPLIFKAGTTRAEIVVTPLNDGSFQPDKTIKVLLDSPLYGLAEAGGNISSFLTLQNGFELPEVSFVHTDFRTLDKKESVTVEARLSRPSWQTIRVPIRPSGNAVLGMDYTISMNALVFEPGQTRVSFTFFPINDLLYEGDRTADLTLQSGEGYTLNSANLCRVIISESNPPPLLYFERPEMTVNRTQETIKLKVLLSVPAVLPVRMTVRLDGTAVPGKDYNLGSPASIVIPNGRRTGEFLIRLYDLSTPIGESRTLNLHIDSVENARIDGGGGTAALTLMDMTSNVGIFHYMFDESSGNCAVNIAPNRIPAVFNPADVTINQPGYFNRAYTFNGRGNGVTVQMPSDQKYNNATITARVRLRGTQRGLAGIMMSAKGGNLFGLGFGTNNKIKAFSGTANSGDLDTFPVNEWRFVALTLAGTTYRTYVQDVSIDSSLRYYTKINGDYNGINFASDSGTRIGCHPQTGVAFNGDIDDVRVFDYVLSEAQLNQLKLLRWSPSRRIIADDLTPILPDAGTSQISVSLSDSILSDVMVQVSGGYPGMLSVSALVFTPENVATAQSIEIRDVPACPVDFPIRLTLSASGYPSVNLSVIKVRPRALPVLTFTESSVSVPNTAPFQRLEIRSDRPVSSSLHVPLTFSGTARMGKHYTVSASEVTIPAGAEKASLEVYPLLNPVYTGDKTIGVFMSQTDSFAAGAVTAAQVVLSETRLLPSVRLGKRAERPDESTLVLHIPVLLDPLSDASVKVRYRLIRNDIPDPFDYPELKFSPGETAHEVMVAVNEGDTMIRLVLDSADGALLNADSVYTARFGRHDAVYVNAAAAGRHDGTSWENAYLSLQTALDRAFPADLILIAEGEYSGSFVMKPDLFVEGGWTASSGYTQVRSGGTVLRALSALPVLRQDSDFLTENSWSGVDLCDGTSSIVLRANGTLKNCRILNHRVPDSVAVILNEKSKLINCVVAHNDGDGVYIDKAVIEHATIVNQSGTGVICSGSPAIYNTLIWRNAVGQISGTPHLRGCAVQDGGADGMILSAANTGHSGANLIAPLNETGVVSVAALHRADWRLSPYSVCINRADRKYVSLTEDLDGVSRIQSGYPDIGAYESSDSGVVIANYDSSELTQSYDGTMKSVSVTLQNVPSSVTLQGTTRFANSPCDVGMYVVSADCGSPYWTAHDTAILNVTPAQISSVGFNYDRDIVFRSYTSYDYQPLSLSLMPSHAPVPSDSAVFYRTVGGVPLERPLTGGEYVAVLYLKNRDLQNYIFADSTYLTPFSIQDVTETPDPSAVTLEFAEIRYRPNSQIPTEPAVIVGGKQIRYCTFRYRAAGGAWSETVTNVGVYDCEVDFTPTGLNYSGKTVISNAVTVLPAYADLTFNIPSVLPWLDTFILETSSLNTGDTVRILELNGGDWIRREGLVAIPTGKLGTARFRAEQISSNPNYFSDSVTSDITFVISGTGTLSDPWRIGHEDHFSWMRDSAVVTNGFQNKYLKIVNSFTVTRSELVPATGSVIFRGTLTGQADTAGLPLHTIRIEGGPRTETARSLGLFPEINQATISGVALEYALILRSSQSVGGVAGIANGVNRIDSCRITLESGASFHYDTVSTDRGAGGLLGWVSGTTQINYSGVTVRSGASIRSGRHCGGLVGRFNSGTMTISNAFVDIQKGGKIQCLLGNRRVGGVVGYRDTGSLNVSKVYVRIAGELSGDGTVEGIGGLIGSGGSTSFSNSTVVVESGGVISPNNSRLSGGLGGAGTGPFVNCWYICHEGANAPLKMCDNQDLSENHRMISGSWRLKRGASCQLIFPDSAGYTLSYDGSDYLSVSSDLCGVMLRSDALASGIFSGRLTAHPSTSVAGAEALSVTVQVTPHYFDTDGSGALLISSADDLRLLAELTASGVSGTGKTYKLTSDLMLTGSLSPIGLATAPFAGTFDGQNHTVTIDADINGVNAGFFGWLNHSAVVRNLKLKLRGSVIGEQYAGGLAGYHNGGTIDSCVIALEAGSRIATDAAASQTDYRAVGGLIGGMDGVSAVVSRCHVEIADNAEVTAQGDVTVARCTGGMIGRINEGRVERSLLALSPSARMFSNVGAGIGQMGYWTGYRAPSVRFLNDWAAYVNDGKRLPASGTEFEISGIVSVIYGDYLVRSGDLLDIIYPESAGSGTLLSVVSGSGFTVQGRKILIPNLSGRFEVIVRVSNGATVPSFTVPLNLTVRHADSDDGIRYISENGGSSGHDGGSWNTAAAVSALDRMTADPNVSEIRFAAGTYILNSPDGVTIARNLKLYGGFDPANPDETLETRQFRKHKTVLTRRTSGRLLTFASGAGRESLADGFTFTGGNGITSGGAVLFSSPDGGVVSNCDLIDNRVTGIGGAVFAAAGNRGMLLNCFGAKNFATIGGGFASSDAASTLKMINCVMVNNETDGAGGAVSDVNMASTSIALNCSFIRNKCGGAASRGAACFISGTASMVKNCIFFDNQSASAASGDMTQLSPAGIRSYCAFSGKIEASDTSVLLSSLSDSVFAGKIPDSVGNAGYESGVVYDFRPSIFSHVIGNGSNTEVVDIETDFSGAPRIVGNCVDIGAHEFQYSEMRVQGLTVSQGNLNCIRLRWRYQPGVEWRVWRSSSQDMRNAVPVSEWQSDVQFDDVVVPGGLDHYYQIESRRAVTF